MGPVRTNANAEKALQERPRMQRLTAGLAYATWCRHLPFIVLGGGAYAATQLPKGSVGSAQIKRSAVTSSKVKTRSLLARDSKRGQLPRGPRGGVGPAR